MDRPATSATCRVVDVARSVTDIPLGPDHPTLDGLPTIDVRFAADRVSAAQWIPGTVHRGAEKLFESRDYRQILMLVDRHDWLSAFCSEIGVVVAVERALGLTPPLRAQHLRILLCELTRIAHHLAFLAPLPADLPAAWRSGAWVWREQILGLLERATGHRVHPMFCQVGGTRADVTTEWVRTVTQAADGWSQADGPGSLAALDNDELAQALAEGFAGVGRLSADQALGFGASGPVARAAGVDLDLRRDDPYLPYPDFRVPLGADGDARSRVRLLVEEIVVSIELVRWATERLTDSAGEPVAVRLPKVIRVPESATYTWTENPTGINGYLLVSRNHRTPWRLKLRSAGFGNADALSAALVGARRAELPAVVASFLLLCGDVDR